MNTDYNYQKPHNTHTIDQFNSCQSDTVMSYHNLSFVDIDGGIAYDTYNVFSDYLDEIRDEYCVLITLTDKQLDKYKYRPKLLCWDLYGNTELAFMILLINDMCNIKSFKKRKILMPRKDSMTKLIRLLFNANRSVIQRYNEQNTTY